MKKLLASLLVLAFALLFVPLLGIPVSAGTYGVLTYTISGGAVAITDCSETASGNLTIPSTIEDLPVTSIANFAFYKCSSLTGITIPDSVTSIGEYVFCYCFSLTGITIPDGVTVIQDYTFFSCPSLGSVTLPDGVTDIGDGAFAHCTSLTGVMIPDSVTGIGNSAFYRCSMLQQLFVPDSVTSIGTQAFSSTASNFVLYCYDDSAAQTYAVNNFLSHESVAPFALESGSPLVMGASMLFFAEKGMTVTALLNEFTNTNITVHKNGSQIFGGAFVGTGCEIRLTAGTLTAKTLTAVVLGDLSGDGACDSLDAFLCDKAVNNHSALSGAYFDAANLDDANAVIDVSDYSMILNRTVGKSAS